MPLRFKMPTKKNKSKNTKRVHSQETDEQARSCLRTVSLSESFFFYETLGKPTGQSASNLKEFLEAVKTTSNESLNFHIERRDFENWIEKTLGDAVLAKRIAKTSKKDRTDIRTKLEKTLEKRINELSEPSLTILVDTEQAVALQKPEA